MTMNLLKVLGLRPIGAASRPQSRLLPDWDAAAAIAAAQIAKLQVALRQHAHPMAAGIANAGLPTLVAKLQGDLRETLLAFDKSSADERGALARQVSDEVRAARARIKAEEMLPLLQSNPLGILVTVGDTLEDALSQMDHAVS